MVEIGNLIKTQLRTMKVIHFTMVMANVIYAVLIYYIYRYAPVPPTITDMQLITSLEYASIPYVLSVVVIAKILRSKMLASDTIFIKKVETKGNSDRPPFIGNYISSLFVVWAIIEVIAIAGIILFLTTGKLTVALALIALGVFFMLVNGPRFEELKKLSTKYESISAQGE